MIILKQSYEFLMKILVGWIFISIGKAFLDKGNFFIALFALSGMVYTTLYSIKFLFSLFKWRKIRHNLKELFQIVIQSHTPVKMLTNFLLLFGLTLLNFMKFTFFTVFVYILKILGTLAGWSTTGNRYLSSSSTSSSSSYTPKDHSLGCVEGQIVHCGHCHRPLPLGTVYDPSRPRCNSCFFV